MEGLNLARVYVTHCTVPRSSGLERPIPEIHWSKLSCPNTALGLTLGAKETSPKNSTWQVNPHSLLGSEAEGTAKLLQSQDTE